MAFREFHYRWEWHFKSTPEALWPVVSDTNLFNRDTDVPQVEREATGEEAGGNGRQRLKLTRLGVPIEWEEEPFEWVRPYRFGVMRRYLTGPVAYMRVFAEMTAVESGGTRLVYEVWARPRTSFGLVAIPAQIGVLGARSFDAAFRKYDLMVQRQQRLVDIPAHVRFAPGGQERLEALRGRLLAESGIPLNLVNKLTDTVAKADDLAVSRLRPYALADHWNAPRRGVLELCLWATRLGLLDFRWDVLCPLCRGTQASSSSLKDVRTQVHCDNCNIDFNINFDRFVELTLKPNAAVREINVGEYCVGGPQVTPHIVAQQLLKPGESRTVTLPLEAGRYRLRTMKIPSGELAVAASDGAGAASFTATNDGWTNDELRLSLRPNLHFQNSTDNEQLFIFERMAWSDTAVTAAEVTLLQTFRDLFSSEALRPGDQISVGSLAILFTDLFSSTRLYRDVGDASAFGLVMDHFDVLKEAIENEEGALVKTIGDAIMAVFRQPAPALRAILNAQAALAHPTDGSRPLVLKAGIHFGPSIAVNMNDRLDYFGSTVNMAARHEKLSSGGDVIISPVVQNDPEVALLLDKLSGEVRLEAFAAALKGFETASFELVRVINDKAAHGAPQPAGSEAVLQV